MPELVKKFLPRKIMGAPVNRNTLYYSFFNLAFKLFILRLINNCLIKFREMPIVSKQKLFCTTHPPSPLKTYVV